MEAKCPNCEKDVLWTLTGHCSECGIHPEKFKAINEVLNGSPEPLPEKEEMFLKELEALINKYSLENESNTPDFLLATFLRTVMLDFAECLKRRDAWFGSRNLPPIDHKPSPPIN